jgi:uncharacterized protein YecE (DUF72 family)
MTNKKLYIGTAGWSYKDWVPSFYPKNQSVKFDWLQFYSHYFNCVEVNSTYYAYMSDKVVSAWLRKTEDLDNFVFTLKLHKDFTHLRKYDQQKIKAVNYVLDSLSKEERLGGLLIQFPYSFMFNDPNANYVRELKEIFQNFICFIEVRHKSWLDKNAIEFLKKIDLAYTTIDQPIIGEALAFKPIVINDKAYIRLHGRNVEGWKKSINNFGKDQTYQEQSDRYNYLYSPGELIEISDNIKSILEKAKVAFVVTNNHPGGHAVANAFQLVNLLKNEKIIIPDTILRAYPNLTRIAI